MKLKTRLLSGLLALILVFSLLPMSSTAADDNNSYTVVINYMFENGEIAAQSYSGLFAGGSDYGTSVDVPAVVGYAPTAPVGYDSDAINVNFTTSQLTYSFTNIQQNITLNVIYVPAEVNYVVKHYLQNVDDDNYAAPISETKVGLTKSVVPETVVKSYTGFYAMPFERPEIAADGSTVVEIYYDRNYYLLTFDLNGGYGVDPIYARYGAPVSVSNPVRAGYTFTGWNRTIPSTMPAENQNFTALWNAGTAAYTVVFWYENADDDGYSYVGFKNGTAASGSTISSGDFQNTAFTGRDSTHFTYNPAKAETVTVAGDGSSIVNVYFTRKTYTLTFGTADVGTTTRTATLNGTALTFDYAALNPDSNSIVSIPGGKIGYNTTLFVFQTFYVQFDGENTWRQVSGGGISTSNYGDVVLNKSVVPPIKTITGKYDSLLVDYWPIVGDDGTVYEGQMWQSSVSSQGNKYVFLEKMPDTNDTLKIYNRTGTTVYWDYYLEVLPGQSTDGLTTRTEGGKTYYLYHTSSGITSALTYAEDYFPITGFTQRDSSVPRFSYNHAYLYYTRNQNTLTYNNYGDTHISENNIYFDTPLGQGRNLTPAYPAGLEANAYEFGGWYTTPQFFPGTEVDWDTMTMPDAPLMVYAYWKPITHNVDVRITVNGQQIGGTVSVPHGSPVPEDQRPATPTNGNYIFVGWFYKDDNGVERAFDFGSMPIHEDMEIYAKWSSNTLVPYTINYVLEDDTVIAEPKTGFALAGTSKTFDAKVGDELYSAYTEGFFPNEKSKNIVMDIEGDNVLTFVYKPAEKVPYTVKYIDRASGEPVATEKYVADNRHSVVTEYAATASGYLPESFQQRLILTIDDENILIFYYNADSQHAIVSQTHYTMTGTAVTEYRHSEEVGNIGNSYTGSVISIENYVLDHITINGEQVANDANLERTLTGDGLIYEFYYKEIDVTINYSAETGGSVSSSSETVAVFSGSPAGSSAIPSDGYRVSGWFTSGGTTANGTTTVNADGSYTFVPAKLNGKNTAATYVAKFVKNEVTDKTVIVDFGLSVKIGLSGQAAFTGISKTAPSQTGVLPTNLFGTSKLESDYGTLALSENKLVYTPTALLDSADEFYYSAQVEPSYYRYASVTVIPATSVYYEDSFVDFSDDDWDVVGTDEQSSMSQALDLADDKANNYGYDPAYENCSTYSMGSARKTTVESGDAPSASFVFKGTGFDVISLTSGLTGTIFVEVESNSGDYHNIWVVDTYYGYTHTKSGYIKYTWTYSPVDSLWHISEKELVTAAGTNGTVPSDPEPGDSFVIYEPNYTWTPTNDDSNALYQIPVIKSPVLDYDTYTVTIYPEYNKFFDHTGSGSYSFYLDAIRIYDPVQGNETALEAYVANDEGYPQYIELRNNLIGQGAFVADGTADGAVFIDSFNTAGDISDYTQFGPNNEVYLEAGQAVAFVLEKANAEAASVQLGAKMLNDAEGSIRISALDSESSKEISVDTATDLYYDITNIAQFDDSGSTDVIVISNAGSDPVSITNIKVTYKTNPVAPVRLRMTAPASKAAASYVSAMYFSSIPVEEIEEPQTFAPEKLSVSLNKSSIKVGEKVTATVTTSSDVDALTVNGESAKLSKTNKRTGEKTWTCSSKAEQAGEWVISVVAYDTEGVASDAVDNVVTVSAKKNGIVGAIDSAIDAINSAIDTLFGWLAL